MSYQVLRNLCYIVASILFVIGLKMLSSKATARKGNLVSAVGMLIAIVTTLSAMPQIRWEWILMAGSAGAVIGAAAARLVKMTSMPEMVGLFNGFGGLASMLVGWAEFHGAWAGAEAMNLFMSVSLSLAVIIGAVTFSGSLIAFGKLAGMVTGKAVVYQRQNQIYAAAVFGILVFGSLFCMLKTDGQIGKRLI